MVEGLSLGNLTVSGGLTRLTGGGSKLDTEAIVAAAYQARRLPAVRLEQRLTRNEARAAALAELRGLLQELQRTAAGLRNPPGLLGANENLFEAKQAFLTGAAGTAPAELVGVSVANRTAPGSFTLEITRLATTHKLAAAPAGATDQTLAEAWNGGAPLAGSIEIGLAGGPKVAIEVAGTMRLDDLRAAINAVTAQTGVAASVLSVSATDRRLILTAVETSRAIELQDVDGDSLAGLIGAASLQPPQTALVTVDGVAVERAGNRIDDVLAGVTLDLYRATPGSTIGVEIQPALGTAKAAIASFVSAYNDLRAFLARHSAVGPGGEVAEDAVLFGDRSLRGIAQTLGAIIGSAASGLPAGTLTTLRDVGITLEVGGRLRLDEATLDARLLGRLGEVRAVFEFGAVASSGDLAVYARSNALSDLELTVAITDADGDGRPEAATLDGVPARIEGGLIVGELGTAYEGLKLIWTGRGSGTVELRLSQGVADRLHNALGTVLEPSGGPIAQALAQIRDADEAMSRQIERIEARAEQTRRLLIERFAAMEKALSLANTMLTQVRAQMDAMNRAD